MRLGLAGGVIVVLVALAIVMLQPGSPRLIEVGCRSLPNQAQFVREEPPDPPKHYCATIQVCPLTQ